jgi:hypothetical protein
MLIEILDAAYYGIHPLIDAWSMVLNIDRVLET